MPIKVDNRQINNSGNSNIKNQPAKAGKPSVEFNSQLKTAKKNAFDGDLKSLISLVKDLGNKFLRAPNENLLHSYKDSIKDFLNKISNDFISLREEFGPKQDGEQKVYQLVKTAESEVESLTKETLTESKAVDLLASLDDIRGLVLDILG
jgi:uncharacterized protein YaaR (DUF327 family)